MPRASKATRPLKAVKATPKKAATKTSAAARGATPTKKASPTKKAAAAKAAPAKKAVATKKATPARPAAPAKKAAAQKVAPAQKAAPAKKAAPARPKKVVLDKWMLEQQALLLAERATYVEQADALKAEADQLAAEMEPGDIQFDDESGEGATATVDRERDLALSAQARQEVEEIDHALARLRAGTYGNCESCGQPIPKARLKAIPHARLCVACKSGGLSRR
jgi:DnaK suppressor protein